MDEFKILLKAVVDAKGTQAQLDAIKNLSVKIEKLNLDQSAITELKNQLSKNGIDINLVFGNTSQIQNRAKQAGKQIGNTIQSGINGVIQKGDFKKVFSNVAGGLNSTGKEAEKYFQTLSNTVSVQEKLDKNNSLESFVVSLKNADGVAEQLRYTLKQIEDDKGDIASQWFEYSGGSISDNGVIKQFNAISNAADTLQIKVEKLKADYSDLNAPKAIKASDHLSSLNQQYDKILQSVSELRSADNSTFTSMQTNVKSEISVLESMIQQYKNAEYAATSLRTKDIATIKIDEGNNLDTFVQKMEQSGHYTEDLKSKVLTLKSDLSNVFDSNSLTAYLNKLSNLQSEFKSVDATAKTLEKSKKLQVNIDSERSILTSYENELKESGVLTENLKQKIKALYDSLGTITTQTGLTTWRAELKGVKSEIEDVIRATSKAKEIQLSISNGDFDTQILSYETSLKRLGFSAEEIATKMNGVNTAFSELKSASTGENIIPNTVVKKAETLTNEMAKLSNIVKQTKLSKSLIADDLKVDNTIVRLNEQLRKNSNYSRKAKAEIRSWIAELEKGNVAEARLAQINSKAKELHANMANLNKIGFSSFDKLRQGMDSFSSWLSVTSIIMGSITAVRGAVNNVKELDDAMLELSKVSDLSAKGLSDVTKEAYKLGETVGKTGTQTINAITVAKRAGYDLKESMELAKDALKLTNVAEGIDDAGVAMESLIHILKGSGKDSSYAGNILDMINEVSNTQSVDFDNLVDGGERLSAVATQAGMSLEQMFGVLTGGYEVLGKMEKVASGGITILSRLQSIQLPDEEDVLPVAKLQETINSATKGVVNVVDQSTGQLRDAYSILDDINSVWNTLDKNTQEGIAIAAGGKMCAA